MKHTENQTTTYAAMGLAALLPGMQHMIVLMQNHLDMMRSQLAALQDGGSPDGRSKPGRKPGQSNSYWDSMSPEERAREMRRRMLVRQGKRKPGLATAARRASEKRLAVATTDVDRLHPRDVKSPRHAAWVKKMQKVQKAVWAKLSPDERVQRQRRMQGGRKAA